jgi:phosphatidylserine/phosphatidylglycerophosphate/cardiolipin synthase-like enzyme
MKTQFISNKTIEQEVIEAISKTKKEICITSPWIRSWTLKNLFSNEVLEKIKSGEISLKLVFRVREREDMKITDVGVIHFLKDVGVEIRHSYRLHAKMVIIDDKVVFASSSNITGGGYTEEGNEEAGFRTDDPAQVKEAKRRFLEIWEAARIFDPDTVRLILTPSQVREFQFVILDKVNEGSFVTVDYEGPEGVKGVPLPGAPG